MDLICAKWLETVCLALIESAERRAPSAERRAPSAERRAPSAERRAPSAERRAPSAERRAPSAERRAPSAERRAPSAERRAPSAERRAPSAERRAPSAERRAPSAERRAPSAERRAPSAERRAPSAERRAPSAERRAPSAERLSHARRAMVGRGAPLAEYHRCSRRISSKVAGVRSVATTQAFVQAVGPRFGDDSERPLGEEIGRLRAPTTRVGRTIPRPERTDTRALMSGSAVELPHSRVRPTCRGHNPAGSMEGRRLCPQEPSRSAERVLAWAGRVG